MNSFAPALLLSMPQLIDPNFNRTVVLLCKHSDEGAFGLVVNRPMVTSGRVIVNDPGARTGEGGAQEFLREDLQVWVGGPVEQERSWILAAREPDDLAEV